MKVFISADIEGVSGVVSLDELGGTSEHRVRACGRLTREVNAAVRGAVKSGASDIRVCDSHGQTLNIFYEDLHPAAGIVRGSVDGFRQTVIMDGLNDTFDVVFLIGYHAAGGAPLGVLSHTWSDRIHEVSLNGMVLSEARLAAYLAGQHGVPVGLVSGDMDLSEEVAQWAPWTKRVVTKEGIDRYAAICKPVAVCESLIEEAAIEALESVSSFEPLSPPENCILQVECNSVALARTASLIPHVNWDGKRGIVTEPVPFDIAFRVFMLIGELVAVRG